ncbi:tRNA lysidine(34) synthetase TilS [Thermodesulfobacterium hveragerdense]|uniref:tRNA lysidine(34) synthetase TilS n=1 Tax=Thermodesulfobacterium hveragerdense TaxID=53424 RepID=UPI00040F8E6E|nr:tRNA lysidine(34) synthetase TilS [Thermodesulfobacterium hveragerdense]
MFINTIKQTIEKFKLLQKGDRVLLAISGGLDSVALLEVFYIFKKEYQLSLFVSHYDHKIRKNSHQDAMFVYQFCKQKGIPFFYTASPVSLYAKREKLSLEMAGRELRYRLWYFLAKKYDFQKVALAHHLDDLAEEIFLKIIKGTGKRGLAGIPIKREDLIIRPFLFVSKEEIKNFAQERGLRWVEDPTNDDLRFLRNRVRHLLIPYLEQTFNKNIKQNLKKVALIIAEEEELIEDLAKKHYEKLKVFEGNTLRLKFHELKNLSPTLRKRIYFLVFQEVGLPLFRITFTHLESLERLVTQNIKGPVYLPGDYIAYRGPGYLAFSKKSPTLPYFEIEITAEGEYLLPTQEILKVYKMKSLEEVKETPLMMCFSAEQLTFPFKVRNRKPGDRVFIPGLGHKKIKKFFQEKGVAHHLRDQVLIVEHKEKIIAIWKIYVDLEYKIKENQEALVLEVYSLR